MNGCVLVYAGSIKHADSSYMSSHNQYHLYDYCCQFWRIEFLKGYRFFNDILLKKGKENRLKN